MTYQPPFTITPKIINQISAISPSQAPSPAEHLPDDQVSDQADQVSDQVKQRLAVMDHQ